MRILKETTRYPERGDKFFIEDGNPEEIAWLKKAFQRFGDYADAYQNGAICLLDSALENQDFRDFDVYPAIFLIRHYIELRIKEFIQGINYCLHQKNLLVENSHDINRLWSEFKKLYSEIGESSNDPRIKFTDELINEIMKFDPNSMSFRYPVDAKGRKSQKLEYINLTNLRESFIRICFVFDGISFLIEQRVDFTEEMLQSMYE